MRFANSPACQCPNLTIDQHNIHTTGKRAFARFLFSVKLTPMSLTLFSIIESATHPNLSPLYQRLGIKETKLTSMRKVMSVLKKQQPDFIVAEFFYGYGNNYAGVNISNLDVMLYSLQKYSPDTRVVVLVDKSERQYVDKLNEIFPIHAVVQSPVREEDIEVVLV